MKFILVLFFLNTSLSSKQINTIYIQKELKWLLIGLPDDNRAKNILAKMYGFQYYPVGGCVVSKKLRDSVNLVNKTTNEILVKKFGINWRWKFDDIVEYIEEKMRSYH